MIALICVFVLSVIGSLIMIGWMVLDLRAHPPKNGHGREIEKHLGGNGL